MGRNIILSACAGILACVAVNPANATDLTGDSANISYNYGVDTRAYDYNGLLPYSFTSTETGLNISVSSDVITIANLGNSSLSFSQNPTGSFLGYEFDLVSGPNLTLSGLTLGSTGVTFGSGYVPSSIGTGPGGRTAIYASLNNATFASNGKLILTLEPSVSAVPEPATWAMMIGGFGLVGGAMRRRQRQQTRISFAV